MLAFLCLVVCQHAAQAAPNPVAWGRNGGQLGTNTFPSTLPNNVVTTGVLSGKTVVSVAAGYDHSLALCSDGTLAAWGSNMQGQLGNPSVAGSSWVPVLVNKGAITGTVIAIAAATSYNLALSSDGTVFGWGVNSEGQLGDGSTTTRTQPVAVNRSGVLANKSVMAIAAGGGRSLALCSDGTVVGWGDNGVGQVGDGTNSNKKITPVEVKRTSGSALAGKRVVSIAGSAIHSLAACSDGTVTGWGSDGSQQIGNRGSDSGTPILVHATTPGALAGKAVVAVSAAGAYSMALCSDGTVVAWGNNFWGQLGGGNTAPVSSPIKYLLDKPATQIAAGASHSLVLCADGTAYGAGSNEEGQIGTGDAQTTRYNTPTLVGPNSGKEFSFVAAGYEHSLGLAISTYSVSGVVRVYSGTSLVPLSGVTVSTGTSSTQTNATGQYTLTGLPEGDLILTATQSGYHFTPAPLTRTVSANITNANFTGEVDSLVVTTNADAKAIDGKTSLREALIYANDSASSANPEITFSTATGAFPLPAPSSGYTITLTSALPNITRSLAISGPGARALAIDGASSYRIFHISNNTTSGPTVNISGLTLQNCNVGSAQGGALYNDYGSVGITECAFLGNSASYGGALTNQYGTITVSGCTFAGNSATLGGGAVSSFSTDSSNPNRLVRLFNCTFSNNSTAGSGGALYNVNSLMQVQSCTFIGNNAPQGGALASYGNVKTLTQVSSSLIVGNGSSDVDYRFGGTNSFQSAGYNIVGASTQSYVSSNNNSASALSAFSAPGDMTGSSDPVRVALALVRLTPLANNGGPTQTIALVSGNPAINGGDPSVSGGFDQRGDGFPRVQNGRMDVGACEYLNHDPVADPQSVSVNEDNTLPITLTGSDPDGDSLTFNVITTPAHGTLEGTAPDLLYTPAQDYSGDDAFTFTVSDGIATSAPATISITIVPINDAPLLDFISDKSVNATTLLAFTATAYDVDSTTLTFSLSSPDSAGVPTGASLTSDGDFTWTPTLAQVGEYNLTIIVIDEGGASASQTFKVTVTFGGGTNTGGTNTGGTNTGGTDTGGNNSGGTDTGGTNTGGTDTGGTNTGGTDTGGTNTGGTDTGGTNTGGTDTGGTNTGGTDTGGTNSGGTNSGGTNTGGTDSGGTDTGGTNSGGTNSGGTNSGGTNSGGTNSGGTNSGGTDSGGNNSGGNNSGGNNSGGTDSGGTNSGGTDTGGSNSGDIVRNPHPGVGVKILREAERMYQGG